MNDDQTNNNNQNEASLQALRLAAEQGDSSSQFELGRKYDPEGGLEQSELLEQDEQKAIYWYDLAAKQEHPIAQMLLAMTIRESQPEKSLELINASVKTIGRLPVIKAMAAAGTAEMQYVLGIFKLQGNNELDVEKDENGAVHWFQLAADQGHVNAQFELGDCLYFGQGCDENKEQAVQWFQLAADQGHVNAQYKLGYCLYLGQGCDEDEEQAVQWFQLAADQGYADAQYKLGYCLNHGQGCDENKEQAVHWFQLAADQGYADAQFEYGMAFYFGQGTEENEEKAAGWFEAAAEQGHADAQYYLGFAYSRGEGVTAFQRKACYWLEKAAEQGHEYAKSEIIILYGDVQSYKDIPPDEIYKPSSLSIARIVSPVKNINELSNKIIPFPDAGNAKSPDKNIEAVLNSLWEEKEAKLIEKIQNQMRKEFSLITNQGQQPIFEKPLMDIISEGENKEIEYKQTFSVNTRSGKRKCDDIRYAALKEITGFLNSNDGVLLIGVSDDQSVIGIEGDGFVGDEDKYGRQIHDIFMEACGEFAASLITVTFERIEDKTVCRILCKKSSKPVYCTYKNNGEKAFVRYGSTTKSPSLSEWDRWRENNF